MNILDLIQGFIIGGSLIIAIGPQNLFVIQQGLKNNYERSKVPQELCKEILKEKL